jgi:transposase
MGADDSLPDDVVRLKAMLRAERAARLAAEAEAQARTLLIEKLKLTIRKLRHEQFGQSSERGALLDQLELQLADLEENAAQAETAAQMATAEKITVASFERRKPARRPLPEHLPRERLVHPTPATCPCCGDSRLRKIGEDVTETLELIPRQWKVIQHVREKFVCRACEAITQPPAPSHPIARGRAGPKLLAHILFAKYGLHLPLNRQSDVYRREGIDLDVSTLADWVGAAAATLRPLVDVIRGHIFAAERIHADDTTVPVLAKGKTRTGRLWTYVRDDRPFAGSDPPAAVFFYSPDRSGGHPEQHLAGYAGLMQADAYAGFSKLYEATRKEGPIIEAACWAHGRRKFFDLARLSKAPIAAEAVKRIDVLFAIEREINSLAPQERLRVRQQRSRPLTTELQTWLREQRAKLSKNSDTTKAINYSLNRWDAFTRFLDDGRLCMSNNAAERELRAVAKLESLCNPSSSVCKHWKHVFVSNATRTTLSGDRGFDTVAGQVDRTDLEGRAPHHLFRPQRAGLDQSPDHMAAYARRLRRFDQSEPFAVLFRGPIGVNVAHAAHRRDTFRRPGFALTGRQAHPVERRGDMFV